MKCSCNLGVDYNEKNVIYVDYNGKKCDLCDKCFNLIEKRNLRLSSYFLCDSCIKELYGTELPKVSILRRIFEVILFVAINLFMASVIIRNNGDSSFKELIVKGELRGELNCVILGIILFILSAVEYFIGRNKDDKNKDDK